MLFYLFWRITVGMECHFTLKGRISLSKSDVSQKDLSSFWETFRV